MLIVNGVTKIYRTKVRLSFFKSSYKHVKAVDHLSFQMEPGKIIGLLGLNGAGKTTTIKMCTTLLEPTSGTITVDGFDAIKDDKKVKSLVNMIAGGERMLYWRLTGRENLRYFGHLYGIKQPLLDETIEELLKEVDLKDAADTPVEQYSKGMKQRLQIARGLINNPKYLFLDEPTLGLDAPIAKHLRSYVKKLAKEKGKAVLLTSHYIDEVEELCDEVYILDKGQLIIHDTPKHLTASLFKDHRIHIWVSEIEPQVKEKLENLLVANKALLESINNTDEGIELIILTEDEITTPVLNLLASYQISVLKLIIEQPKLEDAIIYLAERRVG